MCSASLVAILFASCFSSNNYATVDCPLPEAKLLKAPVLRTATNKIQGTIPAITRPLIISQIM